MLASICHTRTRSTLVHTYKRTNLHTNGHTRTQEHTSTRTKSHTFHTNRHTRTQEHTRTRIKSHTFHTHTRVHKNIRVHVQTYKRIHARLVYAWVCACVRVCVC